MKCPKCGSFLLSVSKLSDYPGFIARCFCGFSEMSIKNTLVIEPENLLPFCKFCKTTRIKNKKQMYCSKECYGTSLKGNTNMVATIKSLKKKGLAARLEGKPESVCPYKLLTFASISHRKAWIKGYREA